MKIRSQTTSTGKTETSSGERADPELGGKIVTALTNLQNCGLISIYSYKLDQLEDLTDSKEELVRKANMLLETEAERDDDLDPELEAATRKKQPTEAVGASASHPTFKVPAFRPTGGILKKPGQGVKPAVPAPGRTVVISEVVQSQKPSDRQMEGKETEEMDEVVEGAPVLSAEEEQQRIDKLLGLNQLTTEGTEGSRRKLTRQAVNVQRETSEAKAEEDSDSDSDGAIF